MSEVALGTTIDDCFGRDGDGFGSAIAWSKPKDDALNDQILFECYYRFAIAKGVQLSLDAEVLLPCVNAGVDNPTVIGSLRAMWEF